MMAANDFARRMAAINAGVYERPRSVREYTTPVLLPSEVVIFRRYAADICDKRVLDLACGAGRTTHYLRHLTAHYSGADLSSRMLAACRRQPANRGLEFLELDMRNVGSLGEQRFDFVLISANGIDHLTHDERLQVLRDLRRVLSERGLLVFSAHNKAFLDRHWDGEVPVPDLREALQVTRFLRHPLRRLENLRRVLRVRRNHDRLRPLQTFADDYSIVVGQAHDHTLLSYWIEPAAQIRQIAEVGFELLETYDTYGGIGEVVDTTQDTREHSAIYYVVRNRPLA